MIEISGLAKTFPAKGKDEPVDALKDVNLTIQDGEFLTILGPSGCGKTTLLRMIAGLMDWDDGEISVDGKPVRGPGPERAMVFQSFALLPWATIRDNVAFGLELRGVSKAKRNARADELIDLVGLRGFETRLPGQLSGGMQQRVGLARALAVDPQILLMDEPFGALDEQTRRLLQEELLQIWEATRKTVIFITHSMEEAVLLGDRVALMSPRPGRIVELVPVPLPRPRASAVDAIEGSAEFAKITASLWRQLREMQLFRRHSAQGRHAPSEPAA
ncbi:MAG: ABC transporter ATP-binding protein [Candidatus Limnocylindrales bacterium]|nr:ABC transporter ATP-binding protein [Candidatus Limnocylindrales bacterium]